MKHVLFHSCLFMLDRNGHIEKRLWACGPKCLGSLRTAMRAGQKYTDGEDTLPEDGDIVCHNCGNTFNPTQDAEIDAVETLSAIEENKWSVQFNSRIDEWTVLKRGQVVGCIGRGRTLVDAVISAIKANL